MWKNRVLAAAFIIASGILVSNYGGTISYALFYFSLCIPVLALCYSNFVFLTFKVYQYTQNKKIVKGETTEYGFHLANEGFILFESIKVNFFHDHSKIFQLDEKKEYCLFPKQKIDVKTRIACDYRGEYNVGVKSVEIIDFLYLFRTTYKIKEKLSIQVLPRIIEIDTFPLMFPDTDYKIHFFPKSGDDEPDMEVRNYVRGDSIKRIHWKASAKRNEWMTRKYIQIPEPEVQIYTEFTPVLGSESQKIIVEDKILEIMIAIVNFYCVKGMTCSLNYMQAQTISEKISNLREFQRFYESTFSLNFRADVSAGELLDSKKGMYTDNSILVITHSLTSQLYQSLAHLKDMGQDVAIIYVYYLMEERNEDILRLIKKTEIRILEIAMDEEVKERLTAHS